MHFNNLSHPNKAISFDLMCYNKKFHQLIKSKTFSISNFPKKMIIQQLLCLQNFIPLEESPSLQIDLSLVESYPPIEKLLRRLCFDELEDDETVQEIYFLLNQFISKEQQTLGPKRFRKFIQNIFTVISQYVINLIRSPHNLQQQVFFHLIYYRKNCGKYIDNFYSCCILVFYVICNFRMGELGSIGEKIRECRVLARELGKEREREREAQVFGRLCAVFEARLEYGLNNLKKAKDSCSKIISLASLQLTQSIRAKRPPSSIVKIQLLLSSLTVSQIYKFLNNTELYIFIVNKCIEYSEKFLQDNVEFLRYLKVDQLYPKEVKIRLTRLEEKIRMIDLVEEEEMKRRQQREKSRTTVKNNKIANSCNGNNILQADQSSSANKFNNITNKLVFSKQKPNQKKSSTFHYATLRSNSSSQHGFLPDNSSKLNPKHLDSRELTNFQQQKQKQTELKNLLIVKDKKKNYYRLKEETLKFLGKENNQLRRMIRVKDREMQQISEVKQKITNELDVHNLQEEIAVCQKYESKLINEIQANKWQHLPTLPVVAKINKYFKCFFQQKYFWHARNVYSLVYGETINMSQMKMISVLRRKATKKSKQAITQVIYNNVKHQVEYIRQSKDNNESAFFLNVYQTEKGQGINQQIEIPEQDYRVIRFEPFYNFYSFYQGKLVSFEKHLRALSLKEAYYVRKFVGLMDRVNPRKGRVCYKKASFVFNYGRGSCVVGESDENVLNKSGIRAIFLVKCHQLPFPKSQASSKHSKGQNNQDKTNEPSILQESQKSNTSIKSEKNKRMLEITVQKVSNNKYTNPNYNFALFTTLKLQESEFNMESVLDSVMCQKMSQIFSKFQPQILTIQKHMRRKLTSINYKKAKPHYHIQTYMTKGVLYTLVVEKQAEKNVFFIQNLKKYELFIKKDVSFAQMEFLSKIESKVQEEKSFQERYLKIEKYLKVKHFASKIFFKSKNIRFFTDFQTQFKRKLCFATIKNEFLFRGKMREGKIMYMLTVKEFSKIPRPYTLRIFTFDKNSGIVINAEKTIFNKEKLFLESKLATINEVVEILSRNEFEIFAKAKAQGVKKVSSRISILSSYSFQSGGDTVKQHGEDKGLGGMLNRRISKNSMFAKLRHKALIRNQDIEAIKNMVDERNKNKEGEYDSDSRSSRTSVVSPVMSVEETGEEQDEE